jgi:hypothetical protein
MPNLAFIKPPLMGLLLAGLAMPSTLHAQTADSASEATDPAAALALLRPAYQFGLPLHASAVARAAAGPLNTLVYQTTPNDPRPLGLPLPNTDLLHAAAWLDLAAGPVILTLPALAGRYHSVAISNMATDLLALLGTRTGSQGGRFALVSLDYTGPMPADATPLRLACHGCRLVARVLIKGPDDLDAATQARTGITLEASATASPPAPADWLATVNMVVAEEGAASLIGQKAALLKGLTEPADRWAAALPTLKSEFDESLATAFDRVNGWAYPPFMVADAAADDRFRAQMAEAAPSALPRVEAMEMETREDAAGQPLDGAKAYRLQIPYNLPIGGFWSVTMYAVGPQGRLSLVPNELDRFAVGDRSDHLRADRNGSTELFIQSSRPQGERSVNWLPAPQGRFALVFRAYLPKSEMLDGSFRLNAVQAAEVIP